MIDDHERRLRELEERVSFLEGALKTTMENVNNMSTQVGRAVELITKALRDKRLS